MPQESNIFQEIQSKYQIVQVAEDLGLKVKKIGATYRADSIAKDGGGENALALYETTNTFFDFKTHDGGDVAQLVALVKFDGDLKAALRELMPDRQNSYYDKQLQEKKEFASKVDFWHRELRNRTEQSYVDARKYLLDRHITLETIKELKIGIMSGKSEFRIVFPYWNESGKEVICFTSRKYPHLHNGEYSETESSPKYKKAPLEYYPYLRNAPLGLNTLKRQGKNGDGTIIITEGMFDFLAFYQEGYSVLCPNGGDFGKNWPEVLEKIGKFRKVILAMDNDEAGRGFTYSLAQKLMEAEIPFYCAEVMTKDVAEYYETVGNLQTIVNSAKPGLEWILESLKSPEDFNMLPFEQQKKKMDACKKVLMKMGASMSGSQMHEAMLSVRRYFPRDWVADTIKEVRKLTTPTAREEKKNLCDEVVNRIADSGDVIYNPHIGFFRYSRKDGCWEQVDEEVIGGRVLNILGEKKTGGLLTSIMKLLKADARIFSDAPVKEFNTKPLISFKNGTLHIDMKTGKVQLKPHSINDYVTVTLPYEYDENAKCDNWLKFIKEVTGSDEESQSILQEFAGYVLMPDNKLQKCLLLKGDGANGKSVYIDVISEVFGSIGTLGRGYVSCVEPSKFRENFRLTPFSRSLMNISSDTESDLRKGEGVFKRIVAGEDLEDSYKYRASFSFKTRSKLFMSCNYFPQLDDTSDGFMRRFLIVEFPMHYVYEPRPNTNERKLDIHIKEKLFAELPGIFNWLLKGFQKLVKQNGFSVTNSKKQAALIRAFRSYNNPMYTFVDEADEVLFDEVGHGQTMDRRQLRSAYAQWCIDNYMQPVYANRFYSMIQTVLKNCGISVTEKGLTWEIGDSPEIVMEEAA